MSSTLTILRQRRHRQDHTRISIQQRIQRAVYGLGFALFITTLALILTIALTYANIASGLPPIDRLPILLNPQDGLLLQPTRIYDHTGQQLLATLAPNNAPRGYVTYDRLTEYLIRATVAFADPQFWQHAGFTIEGWRDATSHPTIAQKLVSDLLLWDESYSPRRAVRERLLAAQLTARYDRRQILEWYLNYTDYGHYAFGAEAAARLYFGKSVLQINLSEAALLAAIGQNPMLNPIDAPQAAEQRRLETLQSMLSLGMISAYESAQASSTPPEIYDPQPSDEGIAQAFVHLAIDQISERIDRARLERGGLVIITTLDYDLQLQTVCAIKTRLALLSGEINNSSTSSPEPLTLAGQDIPTADNSPCLAAHFLPNLLEVGMPTDISAGALILDPQTGRILTAVGDTFKGQERAILQTHAAGTMITPFIYLTGFTRGLNPASLGWDIPNDVFNRDGQYHGPVRLRVALVNDYLPPAVRIMNLMGEESIRYISESFGLKIPFGVRLLKDDVNLSILDIAGVYSIFTTQGTMVGQMLSSGIFEPVAVLRVTGVDNSIWVDWTTPKTQTVVSPQLAYLINNVLSDEVARWPSLGHPNPLEINRPAGVKLGSSLDGTDAWAAGYTPQRVIVVWTGQPSITEVGLLASESLSKQAMDLWHGLMLYAVRDLPIESWAMPSGIVVREVCDPSGLLPTTACPNSISEIFLSGNEPVQADTLYQVLDVNRETGLLATIFTPPELVESITFLIVPPEAAAWAGMAGIPLPPTSYDTIQVPPYSSNVHITSPTLFSDVCDIIDIRGSATGSSFSYYRLEFGLGLNPQQWVQIGLDVQETVSENTLASWDTNGLNGLYALRLMVIYDDQRTEQSVIQVTVDNEPPQISVFYPQEGQEVDLQLLPFQVQIDEPYLARVEFYVDDELVGETTNSPPSVIWQTQPGAHTLRVVAYDRAGNQGEARVNFSAGN